MSTHSGKIAAALALALLGGNLQGCYGGFNLTRKLYTWNGTLGDKWINSIVMTILTLVMVYPIVGALDLLVFNAIQFWTGSNPVTMGPDEKEVQLVRYDGEDYLITATRYRLDIAHAHGDPRPASLVYRPETRTWHAESQGSSLALAQWLDDEGQVADLILPDGSRRRLEQ